MPIPVAWALTVGFALLAVPSVYRLAHVDAVRGGRDARENDLAELLMVVAMVAMVSPLGGPIPAAGWQAVLVLTAGWFLVAAFRGRRCCPVHHTIAAVAMLYMVSAMPEHDMNHGPWLTMTGMSSAHPALPLIAALAAAYFGYDAVRIATRTFHTARTGGIRDSGIARPAARAAMGVGMGYLLLAAIL
ncbi:MAG TPA: DUF5134 domain-containing protein [Amycolatopsis sp.]|jgi:hypothetical protein|nr:DUF5134 domain-containing protein [Amycolatopsis sp.]